MYIGANQYAGVSTDYTSGGIQAAKRVKQQAAAASAQTDTVAISNSYRSGRTVMDAPKIDLGLRGPSSRENAFSFGALRFSNRAWQGEQTAAEKATGFKYYTEPGRVDAEMAAARQAETASLGKKIEKALKGAGIELSKDDKLKFKVAKDGTISVDPSGLTEKSRGKIKEIESALNGEAGLGKQLLLSSAATAVQEADQRRKDSNAIMTEYEIGNGDPRVAAAHRETIDDYLRTNLGFGVDELEAEGYANPESTGLGAKSQQFEDWAYENFSFDELGQIRAHVTSSIDNASKDGAVDFEASYTYQNGTLVDNKSSGSKAIIDEMSGDQAAESGVMPPNKEASVVEIADKIRSQYSELNAGKAFEKELAEMLADSDGSDKAMNDIMEKLLEKIMEKSKASREENHVDQYA